MVSIPILVSAQSASKTGNNVSNNNEVLEYNNLDQPSAKNNMSELEQNIQTGIAFYNRAVTLIPKADGSIINADNLSKQCIELFEKSLPYLEKAHSVVPARKDVITALAGVYFVMNDFKKSKEMQSLLDNTGKE